MAEEIDNTPIIQCHHCKHWYGLNHQLMICTDGPNDGKVFCEMCVRRIPDFRKEVFPNSMAPDPFTDPELNYAARNRMSDRENKHLNESWIRSYWSVKNKEDE